MPELVKETLRAWFAGEKTLSEVAFDYEDARTRPDLLASSLHFVAHSIGGYLFIRVSLIGLEAVFVLWQTISHPYALALLAFQVLLTLYAAVKIGKIAEQLSRIHRKVSSKDKAMIVEIQPAIVSGRGPEREESE